jgi:hypothetical protein
MHGLRWDLFMPAFVFEQIFGNLSLPNVVMGCAVKICCCENAMLQK